MQMRACVLLCIFFTFFPVTHLKLISTFAATTTPVAVDKRQWCEEIEGISSKKTQLSELKRLEGQRNKADIWRDQSKPRRRKHERSSVDNFSITRHDAIKGLIQETCSDCLMIHFFLLRSALPISTVRALWLYLSLSPHSPLVNPSILNFVCFLFHFMQHIVCFHLVIIFAFCFSSFFVSCSFFSSFFLLLLSAAALPLSLDSAHTYQRSERQSGR